MHKTENITNKIIMYQQPIKMEQNIKYLSVTLNRKLTFKLEHSKDSGSTKLIVPTTTDIQQPT